MDRIDRELGLSLWADGAILDYGPIFRGAARDFIERACSDHERMEATSHQVTNILIEFDGGLQSAESETYVTAALRDARTGTRQDRTIRGRYLDSWVKADSRWLITKRSFEHDLTSLTPAL
jgi:phosphatidylserine/phosphatidylglycerophosphate/cardiolipin synthase-like enzyme